MAARGWAQLSEVAISARALSRGPYLLLEHISPVGESNRFVGCGDLKRFGAVARARANCEKASLVTFPTTRNLVSDLSLASTGSLLLEHLRESTCLVPPWVVAPLLALGCDIERVRPLPLLLPEFPATQKRHALSGSDPVGPLSASRTHVPLSLIGDADELFYSVQQAQPRLCDVDALKFLGAPIPARLSSGLAVRSADAAGLKRWLADAGLASAHIASPQRWSAQLVKALVAPDLAAIRTQNYGSMAIWANGVGLSDSSPADARHRIWAQSHAVFRSESEVTQHGPCVRAAPMRFRRIDSGRAVLWVAGAAVINHEAIVTPRVVQRLLQSDGRTLVHEDELHRTLATRGWIVRGQDGAVPPAMDEVNSSGQIVQVRRAHPDFGFGEFS